ncbi:hypothetical protein AB0399_01630 [Streptomyces sp. NPDC088194]|uniref:hypothetical protein n=1 Tax=Streptomyces sp. NPDC088194 TaxID=3154931 RepID=UPI00344BD042
MFAHHSASSRSSCRYAERIPSDRSGHFGHFSLFGSSGRFRRPLVSRWIYDAILLSAVVLAATQHVLARGAVVAAFLVLRVAARLFLRGRRPLAAPGRPGAEPRR